MADKNERSQSCRMDTVREEKDVEAIRKSLASLSNEFLQDISFSIEEKDYIEIEDSLERMKRLYHQFLSEDRTPEKSVSFEQGIYCGEYISLSRIFQILFQNRQMDLKIKKLVGQAHVPEILQTLYYNPEMKHSEIAQMIHIDAGQLSRILDKLTESGFVEKYQESKFSFFVLSFAGKRYVQENFSPIKSEKFSEWPYESLEDEFDGEIGAKQYETRPAYLDRRRRTMGLRKSQYMQEERFSWQKRRA